MEIYICSLKEKTEKGNDQQFKQKLKSFVQIRCCFCQGVGHIAKDCPSKRNMYQFVRGTGANGDHLKNYMYENDVQGWKKSQVGMKLEEKHRKEMPTPVQVNNSLNNLETGL